MGEVFGALGLAWPRLLLYPGGLFALVAGWLFSRWMQWCAGRRSPAVALPGLIDILKLVPPLSVLSLLPLAPAPSFPYGLDLVVALGLLEAPRWWTLFQGPGGRLDERTATVQPEAGAGPTRAELAWSYGPLLVGALCLAEASGGLGLSGLLTWPATWPARVLLLMGSALWLAALPRLLAGPPAGLAGQLRGLGLLLIGALPLIGAMAAGVGDRLPGDMAGWLIPPGTALAVALGLGMVVRVGKGAMRR